MLQPVCCRQQQLLLFLRPLNLRCHILQGILPSFCAHPLAHSTFRYIFCKFPSIRYVYFIYLAPFFSSSQHQPALCRGISIHPSAIRSCFTDAHFTSFDLYSHRICALCANICFVAHTGVLYYTLHKTIQNKRISNFSSGYPLLSFLLNSTMFYIFSRYATLFLITLSTP